MDDGNFAVRPALGITAVERDTGIAKDTLRAWERRYGFPAPARDRCGERIYPPEQVAKLRLLRRLVDAGQRPGKIVALDAEALAALATRGGTQAGACAPGARCDPLGPYLELARSRRAQLLRGEFACSFARLGIERFVLEVAAPLAVRIGEEWMAGGLAIHEEHLFTEALQTALRSAIAGLGAHDARPRILLATFPGEPHELGLLMAEALMGAHGAACLSLGVQTPVSAVAQACRAHDADLVALSFSACAAGGPTIEGLESLRAALPPQVGIWTGGACQALARRVPDGVSHLARLEAIGPAIAAWREHRVVDPRAPGLD